jgi:sRNA-binding protein
MSQEAPEVGSPAKHGAERQRGASEASRQLAVLRERWPLAFPVQAKDVRPLAIGAVGEIAEVTGWTIPFTLGVLGPWKLAAVYCRAVISCDQRIALDGSPAEPIDERAKTSASNRLALLAARKVAKKTASAKPSATPKPASPAKAPAPQREQASVARAGVRATQFHLR